MSKPACATLGLVERLDRYPLRPVVPCDHHLADPLAIVDGEGLVREVHQDNANLATIVGIDRPRRIEQRDAMLQRQPAPWAHLGLITLWQGDIKACRDKLTFQGIQCDRFR